MEVNTILVDKKRKVEVSFLIRVKNEGVNLKRCIDSIHGLKLESAYEIIILDSGSTDSSLDLIDRRYTSIYSIAAKDFQFGSSCNCISKYASGSVYVFLSGHVYFTDNESFRECANVIKHDPMSAGYFRQVPNLVIGANKYEEAFLNHHYPGDRSNHRSCSGPRGFSNAGSIIHRNAILDNVFPDVIASEDIIWARQHLKMGRKLYYFPGCSIAHSHNESAEKLKKRVSINVKAQYGNSIMIGRSVYIFLGVFVKMLSIGSPLKECLKYSLAHSTAYIYR